jgi:hypothetical protein
MFAVLLATSRASASDTKCFPTCRSGFVCSPQGQCVSACNPPCSSDQSCSEQGECIDRPGARSTTPPPPANPEAKPTSAPANDGSKPAVTDGAREPRRRFELTLGLGAQKAFATEMPWAPTPELAFAYTALPGKLFEVFLGLRARINIDAAIPQFGGEVGVRIGVESPTGLVKGGIFASVRPEVVFGHLTQNRFQSAVSFGGALGPYAEVGPVVFRLPIALQGIYTIEPRNLNNETAALLTVSGEAGIRF